MKKITAIILALALMAALCGCGSLNNLKNVYGVSKVKNTDTGIDGGGKTVDTVR